VDLTGKVSVVTGAAQGNGLGIASALASAGSHVLLADINDEQLDRAIGSLRAKGYQVDPVHCDVTEEESVAALMEQAGALGGPHVLVAQAGLDYSNLIPDTTLADWNRIFAVDMVGTFLCVRAAIPRMAELGGGSIITMSGTYAWVAEPGHALHAAAKGAILSFTRGVAVEWGHKKIRCNALMPGWINTPMVSGTFVQRPADQVDDVVKWHALGRIGEPDEVGKLALFLASDYSAFCTGGAFVIDGGQSAGVNSFQKPVTIVSTGARP
jgi:NAD(P)-dependent dehydrogenase (short-subunit alcohol dehydrogenase family)